MHSFEIGSRSNCAGPVLFRSSERFNTHTKSQYWNFVLGVFKKATTCSPESTDRDDPQVNHRVRRKTTRSTTAKMSVSNIPAPSELEPPTLPIALDDVVEGVFKDEFIVLTGVFAGDDGNGAIDDPAARALSAGKGTVATAILKAGGEVKPAITKRKKPKYLVVGHAPGKTKLEAAMKAGIKMITAKGLATVLSGSKEDPEEANLHGVRYSGGYQTALPFKPSPAPTYTPGPGGGADFLGEASSSVMAVTSPMSSPMPAKKLAVRPPARRPHDVVEI